MSNLIVIENGLIPIYKNNENGQVVNARELHEFLEVGKDFTTWIKDRIDKYDFVEGTDFITTPQKRGTANGGYKIVDEYILTLDTAKEIAMVQNNEKGKQVRKYFIAVEKKYKEFQYPKLSKELQAIFAIDEKQQEFEGRLEKLENNMTIDYAQQEKLQRIGRTKIVEALGGKDAPAYKRLNKKAFSLFWNDYKRYMGVNSYKNTAVKDLEKANCFIDKWKPTEELALMIVGANAQMRM